MWYLVLAILGFSSLTIILKLFQNKGVNVVVGIAVNYFVGAIMAFAFAPGRMSYTEITNSLWFPVSIVTGAVFMFCFVVFAISAKYAGVAVTMVSGRAAMAIPVLFAFVVLGEQPTTLKISMLCLILLAMTLIMYKKQDRSQKRLSLWIMLLPLAVFIMNGSSDTLAQYAQKSLVNDTLQIPYLMGSMFASGGLAGVVWYFIHGWGAYKAPTWRDLSWGALLGACNWVCMIGVFNSLNVMEGSSFFPLYYTGTILIATLVGVWAFKERLSLLNYIGVVIALIAIVFLSF